jgi:hypothetical protein
MLIMSVSSGSPRGGVRALIGGAHGNKKGAKAPVVIVGMMALEASAMVAGSVHVAR